MQATVLLPRVFRSFLGHKTTESPSQESLNRAFKQGQVDTHILFNLIPDAPAGVKFDKQNFFNLINIIDVINKSGGEASQVYLDRHCGYVRDGLANIKSAIDKLDLPDRDFKDRLKQVFSDFSRVDKLKPIKQVSRVMQSCQEISVLKDMLVKYYFSKLQDPATENKKQIAIIIGRSINVSDLSVSQTKALYDHTSAPLVAAYEMDVNTIVHYSRELLQATLGARDFKSHLLANYKDLPEDSQRKLALLQSRRFDTFSEEAIPLLIYKADGKTVDQAVIAGILTLRHDLVEKHKLTDLLVQNLPFTAEINSQFVKEASNPYSTGPAGKYLQAIFEGNKLLHDPEDVKRLFNITDNEMAKQIAHLTRLFKHRANTIAASETSRYCA